ATAVGVGGALFVVSLRRRQWEAATAAAALLWVAPTFLLAILVQELQAFIYGHSGLVVAAGFGDISPQQVFWAAIVLGLRPAAYLYRHTRDKLEGELREDYPRTAMAKGLSWRRSKSLWFAAGGTLVLAALAGALIVGLMIPERYVTATYELGRSPGSRSYQVPPFEPGSNLLLFASGGGQEAGVHYYPLGSD